MNVLMYLSLTAIYSLVPISTVLLFLRQRWKSMLLLLLMSIPASIWLHEHIGQLG